MMCFRQYYYVVTCILTNFGCGCALLTIILSEKCVRRACHIIVTADGNSNKKVGYGCGWKYPRAGVASVADCKLEHTDDKLEHMDFVDEEYETERTTKRTRKVKKKVTSIRK